MSTSFVKYTPDIETADPGFDENLQTVIAKSEPTRGSVVLPAWR